MNKIKVFARIQREPWRLPERSYHNPNAWNGGEEKWEPLEGIAAFPVQDIWEEEGGDLDSLLYTIFIEDVVDLLLPPQSERLIEDWEGVFSTTHAREGGYFVLFFFGTQIGELPDGVVVQTASGDELPPEILDRLNEYGFEIREDGVFAVYHPTITRVEF